MTRRVSFLRVSSLELETSSFKLKNSSSGGFLFFEFRVRNFECQVENFEYRVGKFEFRVKKFEFRVRNCEFRV